MATSCVAKAKPAINEVTAKVHTVIREKLCKTYAATMAKVPTKATGELPYFAHSRPASGSAAKTPKALASRHKLKVELDTASSSLISGIRATKAPTTKPLVIKVRVTANLARFCFRIGDEVG